MQSIRIMDVPLLSLNNSFKLCLVSCADDASFAQGRDTWGLAAGTLGEVIEWSFPLGALYVSF
jgi:hypothetical protein